MNLATLEDCKSRLLSIDKLQDRNTEFVQILEMNLACSNDILREFINMKITPITAFSQLYALECYTETAFQDVGTIYSTKKRPKNDCYTFCLKNYQGEADNAIVNSNGVYMDIDSANMIIHPHVSAQI